MDLQGLFERGLRIAARLAIAFGIAMVAAILLGAAVTDNGFVQVVVTFLAALGLWLPIALSLARAERWLERRRTERVKRAEDRLIRSVPAEERSWQRLLLAAPAEADRIHAIRRSIERSRHALGAAELDADAHDLCVLIDRRLPELIDRELDDLSPSDSGRDRRLTELVALVEQFARHCSARRGGVDDASYEAAVLRRRFEARLSEF